jgi:hypothetical protein
MLRDKKLSRCVFTACTFIFLDAKGVMLQELIVNNPQAIAHYS